MTICQSKHNSQSNLLRGCHDSRVNNPPRLTRNSPACGPVPPAAVCTVLNQNLKNRIVNMGSRLYSAVVHPIDNALLTAAVILFPAQFRCTDDKRSLLTKAKQPHPEETGWASYLVSASRSFSVQWNMKSDGYRSLDSIRRLAKGLFCFIIVELSPEKFFSPLYQQCQLQLLSALSAFPRLFIILIHHLGIK